ncbi:MAG: tetratricopeptide repeat protein, partial [Planctomycetota bacterium]
KVEKQKADMAFRTATKAIDSMFNRFVPDHDSVNESGAAISPEVVELMESMLGYYEDIATRQGGGSELEFKSAQAQAKIARIHHRLGQHLAAIDDYEAAIQRLQKIGSDASYLRLAEARLRNQLGRVFEVVNRTQESDQQHKLAIELLGSANLTHEETVELARAHYLLARHVSSSESVDNIPPFRHRERRSETVQSGNRELLITAAGMLDHVIETSPDNASARHLLGLCLVELPRHSRRNRESSDQFDRGIRLLRSLVEEKPNSVDYRFDLLQSLSFGPSHHEAMWDSELQQLETQLKEAIELGEALIREQPGVPLYNLSLAHCYYKLRGVVDSMSVPRNQRMKNRDESRRLNTRAIQLQSSVVHSHPEAIGYRVWLADFILAKFDGYLHERRPEKAHPMLNRTIRVLEAIPVEQRQHPRIKERLDFAYDQLDEFFIPVPD